ncbi:hypothetical protein GLOIN_2v1779027 [Rhizophagus clarus]|uniref:Uncharacterized protein n=1 Tax=Rhizophagus clarus TaxID=94130 RepID=A0A8H3M250_9GLOM|nr:hypothetical protein GLOIN_2v1779027 [Rhizophagus clarus]
MKMTIQNCQWKIQIPNRFSYGEINGSDGLTAEEIKQILLHRLMDGSTPERLLCRVYNATILGLRGREHFFIMADDFKKRKDEIIHDYKSYFSRRSVLANPEFYLQEANNEELALQTGIWYKKKHIGQSRLKNFMLDISGVSLDKMRLQSHHHSDEGLRQYMSSREPEKLDMMNKLVDQFHDQNKSNENEKGQENCGFMKASKVLKVSAISTFQPINNTSMEIFMKPEQFMSLLQNGALGNHNIKINLTNYIY